MNGSLTSPRSEPFRLPPPITRERIEPWIAKEMAGSRVESLGPWASLEIDGFEEIPHPSRILRERSEPHHQIGDLYEEILERDDFLSALYAKLWDAVLALEWFIDPATDEEAAVLGADLCRYVLTKTRGLSIILGHLCSARPMGLAVVERVWDVLKSGSFRGALTPVAMADKPLRRFAFRRRDRALAVRHLSGERRFVVAPPGKFITVSRGSLETPWGAPELDRHYWTSWMTQHGAVYWSLAVERYADPIPEVRFPWRQGSNQSNQAFQGLATAALEALNQGKGVSIPQELETQLHEVSSSGGMSYPEYMAYWNRIKALRILAEIRTSGLHQGHGSYAAEETSKSLFVETVKLAARQLAFDVKTEILAPIVSVNLGSQAPVPNFRIDVSDADDRRLRMDGLRLARELGLSQIPEEQAYRIVGVPKAEPGQETLRWPARAAAETPPRAESENEEPEAQPEDEPAADPVEAHQSAAVWSFSQRREVEEFLREAEATLEAARPAIVGHWSSQRERVETAFSSGDLGSGAAYSEIFSPERGKALGDRLHALYVHGLGLGLQQLQREGLDWRSWRAEASADRPADLFLRQGPELTLMQGPGSSTLENGGAAAAWWAERLSVPRDVFLGLDEALRRLAFTVAGVEDVRLLGAIQRLLAQALAEGWDRQLFRERLEALYRERGLLPTSSWHADLLLQNALAQSAGAIRWEQTVGNPSARRLVPYLRFGTVGDN
ncbi:MAG: DUF935 family protein, partial [Acidobacteriota bacterium]